MKNILVLIVLVSVLKATAQDKPVTSKSLTVSGKIKTEITYTLSDLDTFKKADIGNMIFLMQKK